MQSGLILIVDDEASIRGVLGKTLSSLGFTTVQAARGEEALSLIRTNSFDAVLLDINMPGMNGVDACRRIRSLDPRLPILMITVRDDQVDMVEALNAGANDYVTKPFHLRELAARIGDSMRGAVLRDHDAGARSALWVKAAAREVPPGRSTYA
jgi:two-component system KDP operon response regulator KdpE